MPVAAVFAALAAYVAAALLVMRSLAPAAGDRPVDDTARRAAWALGLVAALLHAASLGSVAIDAGGFDLAFLPALSWVAVVLALLTLLVSAVRPVLALAAVVFPIAALVLVLHWALAGESRPVAVGDWRIQLHAALALVAYALLCLAALVAIMLWVQDRALRQHRLRVLLPAFPPLTLVEALLFRLILAGFVVLTLALVTGVLFVEDLLAQHLAHKTLLSLLAWLVLGTLLAGRWRYGWRGRRALRLVLLSMGLLLLAFFGSKFVLEFLLARGS